LDQFLTVENARKRLGQRCSFEGEFPRYMNQVPPIDKPGGDGHVLGISPGYILPERQEVVAPVEVATAAMQTSSTAHRGGKCHPIAHLEPVLSIYLHHFPRDFVAKGMGQGDGVVPVLECAQVGATDGAGTHSQNDSSGWARGALGLKDFQVAQRLQKGCLHVVLRASESRMKRASLDLAA
jgi:hypothetical protein